MPVLLDELDTSAAAVALADPKFFSSKLTGSGKKIGLLSESLHPVNMATNTAFASIKDIEVKSSTTQSDITTTMVPLAPLTKRSLLAFPGATIPVPHKDDRFALDITDPSARWDVVFDLTPQSLALYEDKTQGASTRTLVIQYRMEAHFLMKGQTEAERTKHVMSPTTFGDLDDAVMLEWDTSPIENAEAFLENCLRRAGLRASNLDELETWMREEYSVYQRIARLAQLWDSMQMAEEIGHFLKEVPANAPAELLNNVAMQLRYLENYKVPLDAYRDIHSVLTTNFTPDVADVLAKQNMTLLNNHSLSELGRHKDQLIRPGALQQQPNLLPHLSAQQLGPVTTDEPLVMVQAGAGTGKSSVILQRTEFLKACGVPESDITVLSFTNAAADNISEKNPALGSMTISRMIIDIYALNHPTHQVSANETIINSLDIFFPNNAIASTFRKRLVDITKRQVPPGAFTALNTFVENHYDQVITILDRIQQTSLDLQIIICYQKIDQMAEPAHVLSKYLIIDEVQDNSEFEFIYLLRYVLKHKQSLFIVGDASQTLYEFRAANPKALNTLEGSGVFKTFRLSTNYRSNQEILDFANVELGGLETNQFANIRLQANSLDMPTADSFREKVQLKHHAVQKISAFVKEDLDPLMQNVVIPGYVQDCLDRGEQVAFLAYSRAEVMTMQKALERMLPDKRISSLVSDKPYASDLFSKFIKMFWNDILQVSPKDASFAVFKGIQSNAAKLSRGGDAAKSQAIVDRTLRDWWGANAASIQSWVVLAHQGKVTHAEFFQRLQDNLLTYEIDRNREKLNITKQRNQDRKKKNLEAKPDLIVSTIHGAKGLEFDNVVVLYKDSGKDMSQEAKRLYYVAFTRAMKTQFVLAYSAHKNPAIVGNHQAIIGALEERDKKVAQAQADAAATAALLGDVEDVTGDPVEVDPTAQTGGGEIPGEVSEELPQAV